MYLLCPWFIYFSNSDKNAFVFVKGIQKENYKLFGHCSQAMISHGYLIMALFSYHCHHLVFCKEEVEMGSEGDKETRECQHSFLLLRTRTAKLDLPVKLKSILFLI